MIDFIPPHNKDFEEMILGSILYEPELIQKCILDPEDFYFGNHLQLYQIFQNLRVRNNPIDLLTVAQALEGDPQGAEKLTHLNTFLSQVASTANFSHYESQVKEFSFRRQLVKVFISAIRNIGEASADETISLARKKFSEILSGKAAIELVPMKAVVKEVIDFVERRAQKAGALSGIGSDLKDLDEMTDGFQGSDLIIIAGRPGAGKSALAMHIAERAAIQGFPAGVLHLEMGIHQVGIRSLASMSNVGMWKLRKGSLGERDWSPLIAAAGRASELPIWFSFTAMQTKAISRVITSMVEEKGCKIILLDYLQLAQDKDAQKREREVANTSALLKATAKTYNIPVIAVAQLNRDVEREKRKPRLSDLRESGAIEQDADVVLFLHKEEEDSGRLEIIVGKGRNIGIGSCYVAWDRKKMSFHDYTEREEK